MASAYMFLLAILLSCVSRVGGILDDTGIALNMLQLQAKAREAHDGLGPDSNTSLEPAELLQPRSQIFRMLEKHGVSDGVVDGVSVIVPGLGDYKRALLVQRNMAWLRNQNVPFDCTIYIYRSALDFPLTNEYYEPCKLVEHAGYWMDHVKAFPLHQSPYRWVLHWIDSVEPLENFNLRRLIEIMKANSLSHAAPTFQEYGQYPIMQSHNNTQPGRKVSFIELQMDVFAREYFACMQDVAASDPKGMGWGMDKVLPALCRGDLGLIDEMNMVKKFKGSYNYREATNGMAMFLGDLKAKHPGLHLADISDVTRGQLVEPPSVPQSSVPQLTQPATPIGYTNGEPVYEQDFFAQFEQ